MRKSRDRKILGEMMVVAGVCKGETPVDLGG